MPAHLLLDVATPGMVILTLGLGLIALILLTLLVALVEGVVLTLFKWNNFRRSLLASLIANVVSSLAGGVLLIFLQEFPVNWMFIALLLSIAIEGAILVKIQPGSSRRTWPLCLLANLASYLLLILPAYLFSLFD
jgi:hypothetical protein